MGSLLLHSLLSSEFAQIEQIVHHKSLHSSSMLTVTRRLRGALGEGLAFEVDALAVISFPILKTAQREGHFLLQEKLFGRLGEVLRFGN